MLTLWEGNIMGLMYSTRNVRNLTIIRGRAETMAELSISPNLTNLTLMAGGGRGGHMHTLHQI